MSDWHPDDYYRASRAARTAWQHTNQQLALETDTLNRPAADPTPRGTPGRPVERSGLDTGATEPRSDPPPGRTSQSGASVAPPHPREPEVNPPCFFLLASPSA